MGVAGRKPSIGKAATESKAIARTGEPGAVQPPEILTPEGQAVWDTLLPDLISMGAFRESDVLLLTELCETLAEAQAFRRQLRDEPDKSSPEAKRLRAGYLQSMKLVMSIAGEFGISPVARLRLGLMRIQGSSLLEALAGDEGDA